MTDTESDELQADGVMLRSQRGWYVSAPHLTVRMDSGLREEQPFSVGHLRRVGAAQTACGTPALNWPILWTTPWEAVRDQCGECQRIARCLHARANQTVQGSGNPAPTANTRIGASNY